jgi:uncharacterized protein (DUF1810 family)
VARICHAAGHLEQAEAAYRQALEYRNGREQLLLGYPDDLKLQSSMTLFASVAGPDSVFVRVLDKYFQGERDVRTLQLLEPLKGNKG